ncbi:cytochrome P450 [Rhizoctonia solani]|nr:cytochrome P450 [Rhizoctonia solani]
MSTFNSTSFNAVMLQLASLKYDRLFYALLGTLGATGALGLFKSLSSSSDISNSPGPLRIRRSGVCNRHNIFYFISLTLGSPSGNVPELFDAENGIEFQDELMKTYGSACRVKGLIDADELWISDPRALQEILIKGHDDFKEPVLSTVYGHQYKIQRKILNPVFTASHIRNCEYFNWMLPYDVMTISNDYSTFPVTPTMSAIAHNLVDVITSRVQVNRGTTVVDIFKWVNLVALEIIGQTGMGDSFGALVGKVPEYLGASGDMFPLMMEMWCLQPLLPFTSRVGPAFFRRSIVERISHRPVQAMKNAVDAMNKTVEIMQRKWEAPDNGTLDSEVASGQDIMTALQNRVVAPNDQMSDEEILAQVNGLAFAGHHTTSSAISRTISVLAEYQEIQDKLELKSAKHTVCIARIWTTINSTRFPNWTQYVGNPCASTPLQQWEGRNDPYSIPEGTDLRISLRAANQDKQIWGGDSEEFRPDRWLEPLPVSVTDSRMPGIFSSTMTFLGGPRACPGMKFSQLEMKIVLSILVSSFRFEPSKNKLKWKNDGIVKPYV